MVRFCKNCGHKLEFVTKFCVECGIKLDEENIYVMPEPENSGDKKVDDAGTAKGTGNMNISTGRDISTGGVTDAGRTNGDISLGEDIGADTISQEEKLLAEHEDDIVKAFTEALDEKNMKLLADFCRKSCGLPIGDNYDEVVLYQDEKNGTYQVHSFSGTNGSTDSHRAYYIDEESVKEILDTIKQEKMAAYKNGPQMPSLCGGDYIFKFVDDNGQIVRLSTANYDNEGIGKAVKIAALMNSKKQLYKPVLPEFAKHWTRFAVDVVNFSEEMCYSLEIEKKSEEEILFKGRWYSDSKWFGQDEFKIMSTEAAEQIKDYPFGALNHKKPTGMGTTAQAAPAGMMPAGMGTMAQAAPAGMPGKGMPGMPQNMMNGMMTPGFGMPMQGMNVSGGKEVPRLKSVCRITYENGWIEEKIPDRNLMEKVFRILEGEMG